MKAIHSFRSDKLRPYLEMVGGPELIKPAIYIMALSAATIRKQHKDFLFITDRLGKELAEACKLPYTEVQCVGESFDSHPCFWVHSKVHAYSTIHEPFIHYDTDFFLWDALPANFLANDVVAFHSETFVWGKYEEYNKNLLNAGFTLPPFMQTYWTSRMPMNMALFGGNNWKAINEYGNTLQQFIEDNHGFNYATDDQRVTLGKSIALIEQLWVSYVIQDKLKVPIAQLLTERNVLEGSGDAKVTHLHGFKQEAMRSGKTQELLFKLEAKLNEVNPEVYSAVRKFVTSGVDIDAMVLEAANGQDF